MLDIMHKLLTRFFHNCLGSQYHSLISYPLVPTGAQATYKSCPDPRPAIDIYHFVPLSVSLTDQQNSNSVGILFSGGAQMVWTILDMVFY